MEKKNNLFRPPLNRTEKGTVAKIKSSTHPLCPYQLKSQATDQLRSLGFLDGGRERTLGMRLLCYSYVDGLMQEY